MRAKDNKRRIREHFLLHPTARLRIRQIERSAKVALPSAVRYAKELEKEGFLKKTEIADVTAYSADRTSRTYLLEKRLFNLRELHASGLIDYIIESYSNPAIILFGSYARGEDIEESDIDIYIQTPSDKDLALSRFETRLQRKLHIMVFKDIKRVRNKELANNIINGITINGFIEVFR